MIGSPQLGSAMTTSLARRRLLFADCLAVRSCPRRVKACLSLLFCLALLVLALYLDIVAVLFLDSLRRHSPERALPLRRPKLPQGNGTMVAEMEFEARSRRMRQVPKVPREPWNCLPILQDGIECQFRPTAARTARPGQFLVRSNGPRPVGDGGGCRIGSLEIQRNPMACAARSEERTARGIARGWVSNLCSRKFICCAISAARPCVGCFPSRRSPSRRRSANSRWPMAFWCTSRRCKFSLCSVPSTRFCCAWHSLENGTNNQPSLL
jgi:hypothetical protein